MANKLGHLLDAFRRRTAHDGDWVLATVIETQGSTYQKAGARMLITPDGEWLGLLGGGCFEGDLAERAGEVFATGRATTVFYDMRAPDDLVWGLGLGCNGAIRILLQLLKAEEDCHPLNALAEAVEHDRRGVLLAVFASDDERLPVGCSLFLAEDGFDTEHSPWPAELIDAARRTLADDKPRLESHLIEGKSVGVFYDPIRPLPRLLVVGAGLDAIPLAACAKALGWRVTVADHRPAYVKPERFASAERLLYCLPQHLADELELDCFDALVLMTHSFEYDSRFLKVVADSRIPFIGLLGPHARKNRLLDSLGEKAAQLAGRAFGPVGLDIGAASPEEIALSIMAGILAERNKTLGGPLDPKYADG